MWKRLLVPAVLAIAFLAVSSPARADDSHGVFDNAGLFGGDAVDQANGIINNIKQDHGLDLVFETFPAIPDALKDQFNSEPHDTFYDHWLTQNAEKRGVKGVYVLIVKDPGHVQVGVGKQTRQRAFTYADRDKLKGILLAAFKQKQFDQGLTQGAQFVQTTMDQNLASANGAAAPLGYQTTATPGGPMSGGQMPAAQVPAPNQPMYPSQFNGGPVSGRPSSIGSWSCVGVAIVILIGLFLLRLIGHIAGMSVGSYNPGPMQGGGMFGGAGYQGGYGPNYGGGYAGGGYGGGGGFGRGLLGGLLGGAAGSWLYDSFRGDRGERGGGYQQPGPMNQGLQSPPPDNSGPSSVGGDFGTPGNSTGGSDFGGGGGSAGGDFGGGGGGGGGDTSGGGGSTGGDF